MLPPWKVESLPSVARVMVQDFLATPQSRPGHLGWLPEAVVRKQNAAIASELALAGPETSMTTIAENSGLVTAINVFTVDPSNQQRLLDLLARMTESSVRGLPGFVSAALHRSVDGCRVTMYAQWESARHYQDYQALRAKAGASPEVTEILAIARFDPATYEVVKVFAGPSRSGPGRT